MKRVTRNKRVGQDVEDLILDKPGFTMAEQVGMSDLYKDVKGNIMVVRVEPNKGDILVNGFVTGHVLLTPEPLTKGQLPTQNDQTLPGSNLLLAFR